MDEIIWSTVDGEIIHPLNKIWADSFLVYTNIPGNGPSRQNSLDKSKPESLQGEPQGGEPTFSLENLRGAFIPFGCGDNICPDRHFCKDEMMFSFKLLCTMHDTELCKGTIKPEADLRHYGHAMLPSKGTSSIQDQTEII